MLAVVLIMSLLITASLSIQKNYYSISLGDLVTDKVLLIDICRISFKELFSTDPSEHVIDSSIIELLKKEPLNFSLISLNKVFQIDERICQVVAQTDSGLKSFNLKFAEDKKLPFLYKLIWADEVAVIDQETKE